MNYSIATSLVSHTSTNFFTYYLAMPLNFCSKVQFSGFATLDEKIHQLTDLLSFGGIGIWFHNRVKHRSFYQRNILKVSNEMIKCGLDKTKPDVVSQKMHSIIKRTINKQLKRTLKTTPFRGIQKVSSFGWTVLNKTNRLSSHIKSGSKMLSSIFKKTRKRVGLTSVLGPLESFFDKTAKAASAFESHTVGVGFGAMYAKATFAKSIDDLTDNIALKMAPALHQRIEGQICSLLGDFVARQIFREIASFLGDFTLSFFDSTSSNVSVIRTAGKIARTVNNIWPFMNYYLATTKMVPKCIQGYLLPAKSSKSIKMDETINEIITSLESSDSIVLKLISNLVEDLLESLKSEFVLLKYASSAINLDAIVFSNVFYQIGKMINEKPGILPDLDGFMGRNIIDRIDPKLRPTIQKIQRLYCQDEADGLLSSEMVG
jgi:hypothetical protein